MKHTSRPGVPLRDLQTVRVRVAVVRNHRLVQLARHLHLPREHHLLPRAGALVLLPVIIQPDLSNRAHARLGLGHFFNDCKVIIPVFVDIFRVNANRRIDKRIFLCVAHRFARSLHITTRIEYQPDVMLRHGQKQLVPVGVKTFIIIMGMGIKQHLPSPQIQPKCAQAFHSPS